MIVQPAAAELAADDPHFGLAVAASRVHFGVGPLDRFSFTCHDVGSHHRFGCKNNEWPTARSICYRVSRHLRLESLNLAFTEEIQSMARHWHVFCRIVVAQVVGLGASMATAQQPAEPSAETNPPPATQPQPADQSEAAKQAKAVFRRKVRGL